MGIYDTELGTFNLLRQRLLNMSTAMITLKNFVPDVILKSTYYFNMVMNYIHNT